MDKTSIFDIKELRQEYILLELADIVKSLEECDYSAANQLVGYLLSGDASYITSYKKARGKIKKIDRSELLMAIINGYLGR